MRVRTRRSRPIGASIVPVRAGGRPSTSARYSRRIVARARATPSARGATASLLATTSSPDVSRSRRWTIPARQSSSPPAIAPRQRLGERALAVPARRDARRRPRACRRRSGARPRRRSRTARRRVGVRRRRARRAAARRTTTRSPPRTRWPLRAARAVDEHAPGLDQPRGLRARAERPREERVEPLAGGLRPASSSQLPSRRRSIDEHEHDDADRDRRVRDVERRPVRQLDEVDDRALADAVDDVAERAAEQQARRQPDPAAARRGARSTRAARRPRPRSRADDDRPAVLQLAERDAGVAHVDELDAGRRRRAPRRAAATTSTSAL